MTRCFGRSDRFESVKKNKRKPVNLESMLPTYNRTYFGVARDKLILGGQQLSQYGL